MILRETAAAPAGFAPDELGAVARRFADRPVEELLRWAFDAFRPDPCVATSFGPQSIVILHLISRLGDPVTAFYLDTGLLFAETLDLRARLEQRLGIRFLRVATDSTLERQASLHGDRLWAREPDRCCAIRKVEPLRRFLATRRAWISGIRAEQTAARRSAELVEWDEVHGLVKINPLLRWTTEEVWRHLRRHDLPVNALHERGYPSIGCIPCTRPVAPGEDPRAGRWTGREKTECGIHVQPESRKGLA